MTKISASAITYTEGGDLDKVLHGTSFSIDADAIGPKQVVVQAIATPINPSDLGQIKGGYASKPTLTTELSTAEPVAIGGNEGLYRVIKVGTEVSGYAEGDWVIPKMPSFGTWRTHAVVTFGGSENPDPFIKVSSDSDKSLSIEQASTISINPCTAYQLIDQFITDWDPKGNDWIIQNAGNSQVSKFVLQIAKLRNINTISIIRGGKPNHDEIVEELLDLGATKVITEEEAASEKYIQEVVPGWLNGGTIILALNSVGGQSCSALVSHLVGRHLSDYRAPHIVTYGVSLGQPMIFSSSDHLFKNVTAKAYWLTANTKRNPDSKVKTVKEIIKLYQSGSLKPVPYSSSKFDIASSSDHYIKVFLQSIKDSSSGKQVVVYD